MLSSPLSPCLHAATPTPTPVTPKAAAEGEGESFAKALNDAAEPEAPAPGSKPVNGHRPRTRAAEAAESRRPPTSSPTPTTAATAGPGTAAAGEAFTVDDAAPHHGDGNEPEVPSEACGLLADIQNRMARLPPVPTAPATTAHDAHGEATATLDTRGTPAPGARAAPPSTAADLSAVDKRALPLHAAAGKLEGASASPLAEGATASTQPDRAAARIEQPAFTLPPPVAQPAGASAAAAAAPPAEASIPAPVNSPEFALQLGATLSTFVRDGIGHAQLHLNPAEMGPVSVQIQLDGQNAQVLLGADHASTRQALEQSLPLLAGSLREAGLTLAGGGVFEQGQQARDGSGQGGARGDKARHLDTLPPQPLAASPQRRGVVDLVA